MALNSVNMMDKFDFQNANIETLESKPDMLVYTMTGVITKMNHPVNNTCVDIYNDVTTMRVYNPVITRFLIEGQKVYNANGVLIEEIPDVDVPVAEYGSTMKKLEGSQVFVLTPKAAKTEDRLCFEICTDVTDPETEDIITYWMEIEYDKTVLDWDKFLNKAGDK